MLEGKKLDKSVPIPLYFQLKKLILEEIRNGSYPIDSMIPTENELSAMFGISRTTIRQAIIELVQEGRLYRVKSKGTFVARPKIKQDFINRLQSFDNEIIAKGRIPSTGVLAMEVIPASAELTNIFGENGDKKVIFLYRVRCADNEPIVRVKTYLPYEKCRFALEHDFTREKLYNVLSENPDTKVIRVSRDFEAVGANKEDVEVLKLKKGQPVHFFKTIGYNAAGEVIEYSFANYRGDQNCFHVDLALNEE